MASRFTACIVAAGRGERAGGSEPKQFRPLAGKPMLRWSVETFSQHRDCAEIVIACAPDQVARVEDMTQGLVCPVSVVPGGTSRTASVRAALEVADAPHVLIHDAARPGVTPALIDRLLAALDDAPGAVPVLPVADALTREDESGLVPVSRDGLMRLQTPQAFERARLTEAFTRAGEVSYPDESALARATGLPVATVPGEERNFKVTWPEDFERMASLLQPNPAAMTVSGSGYDVHRLAPGDGLTLCGVFIDCSLRLVGHSDADAGLHAITDALLGASGQGDIGQHFPPTDARWKDADSVDFLRHALGLAREAGASPVHVDVTLICERPRIGPFRDAMRTRVAAILDLAPQRVNIKATTTEKLGFTGRGEGLAAEAIVTVRVH
ncbi:bifunctional enzyme IspD/IspF [Marinicauda pacifica]|uniref:Bifunctional enzyme IspD/IspF n=1 Tax=Marinicauda pacifica TaxID=1133559 RepID=A0A4S2HEJ5_9PROT|nr:bifunctional 2-C-methyl-D-erythritol 4-phosphate cytidylyltransferase/2-C-methyl-D-erythritol 2,4-cyclodiphosphate synthase [Marinicauda pacifica]TGY94487.1 bifunctional 2-C-methyl-D-erythritol 4-phosphate cytidylyltransferase/2-C-methyl-D-erythritol 2,4-cyclodiphosphate synthase [Marinicauda pacifica]GGE36220.1 bifunctional enzyme IspD/IspF [Marinicauda pacifica]